MSGDPWLCVPTVTMGVCQVRLLQWVVSWANSQGNPWADFCPWADHVLQTFPISCLQGVGLAGSILARQWWRLWLSTFRSNCYLVLFPVGSSVLTRPDVPLAPYLLQKTNILVSIEWGEAEGRMWGVRKIWWVSFKTDFHPILMFITSPSPLLGAPDSINSCTLCGFCGMSQVSQFFLLHA